MSRRFANRLLAMAARAAACAAAQADVGRTPQGVWHSVGGEAHPFREEQP